MFWFGLVGASWVIFVFSWLSISPLRYNCQDHFTNGETEALRGDTSRPTGCCPWLSPPVSPDPSLTHHHDVELKPHLHGLDLELVQHSLDAHVTKPLAGEGPRAGGLWWTGRGGLPQGVHGAKGQRCLSCGSGWEKRVAGAPEGDHLNSHLWTLTPETCSQTFPRFTSPDLCTLLSPHGPWSLARGAWGRGLSGETEPLFWDAPAPGICPSPTLGLARLPQLCGRPGESQGPDPWGWTQRETGSFVGTWWPWVPVGALGDCPVLAAPGVCGEGEGTGDS